jgi:5-methylcytosine-specific restriction endonuclease McrA
MPKGLRGFQKGHGSFGFLKGRPSPLKGKHTGKQRHPNILPSSLIGRSSPLKGKPSPLKGRKGRKFQFKARKCFHKADLSDRLRHSPQYEEWRTSVFKRDSYTCQKCGQVGGELEVDHIIPFSTLIQKIRNRFGEEGLYERCLISKELWDINNGMTLSKDCHRKTNTYGGYARRYKKVIHTL